ncbi:MAG: protein translocase subunit SecD [Cellulosilyticaceae bacterium]
MKGNTKTKLKSAIALILMLAVVAGSGVIAYMGVGADNVLGIENIRLGLDLQGGVNIVYEAAIENPTAEDMKAAQAMIQNRLDKENYTEAETSIEGDNRIRVDIPGVDDPQKAINEIAATAMLVFYDGEGKEILTGKNISKATPQIYKNNLGVQEPCVSIEMDKEGAEIFSEFTKNNIGKPIIITLDGVMISQANIQSHISDGAGMISGNFTPESAQQLAERIEAGSLPFALKPISSQGVGAKLGMDAFNTSIKAGVIGFFCILVFMMVLFRMNGVAANIALTLYVGLVLMVLSYTEATLTLPGIAGILLSIGMAVDANVIIFTRIKEELATGRGLRPSIDAGFSKAFSAIIDGNVTTMMSAVVLYVLGTGLIKSFAMTLIIGIVVSLFTALLVTRYLIRIFVGLGIKNPVFYGAKKAVKNKEV